MGFTHISYMRQTRPTELKHFAQSHKNHDPLLLSILPCPHLNQVKKDQSPDKRPKDLPAPPHTYNPAFMMSLTLFISPCPPYLHSLGHSGFLTLPRRYSHVWTFALAVPKVLEPSFSQYLLHSFLYFLESLSLMTLFIPPTTLTFFILLPCFHCLRQIGYFY